MSGLLGEAIECPMVLPGSESDWLLGNRLFPSGVKSVIISMCQLGNAAIDW